MVSGFTYLSSGYLSGYANLKIPFLRFFPKSIDVVASTIPLPFPWFRLSSENNVIWSLNCVSCDVVEHQIGPIFRFFRLLTVAINIFFHSLRFPWFTIFGNYRVQTWYGANFAGWFCIFNRSLTLNSLTTFKICQSYFSLFLSKQLSQLSQV